MQHQILQSLSSSLKAAGMNVENGPKTLEACQYFQNCSI